MRRSGKARQAGPACRRRNGPTDLEHEVIDAHHWWSADELRSTTEQVRPDNPADAMIRTGVWTLPIELKPSSRVNKAPQLARAGCFAPPMISNANGANGPTITAVQNHRRDDLLRSRAIAEASGMDPIETITKIHHAMILLPCSFAR